MAQTLKIRKGDTVQVMKGKDRGKQGRVLEANPKLGRILVENVNMIVRHQRPRPIQKLEPHGRPADHPGRPHRKGVAGARLERDGHLPDVQRSPPASVRTCAP